MRINSSSCFSDGAIGNDGKLVFFLHIPRSCGTCIINNVEHLTLDMPGLHNNGNPIDSNGNWIPFWKLSPEKQAIFLSQYKFICNERMLGSYFQPDKYNYVTCLRNPSEVRLSLLNKYLIETLGHTSHTTTPQIEAEAIDSLRDYFPSNILTWMCAIESESQTADYSHLDKAIDRLSYFQKLFPKSLKADFKATFNKELDSGKGKHNLEYIFKMPIEELNSLVAKDIELDNIVYNHYEAKSQ